MSALLSYQQHFVTSANIEFVAFIPETDAPAALLGQVHEPARRFSVQTAKNLQDRTVTPENFASLQRTYKEGIEQKVRQMEAQLPGLSAQLNQKLRTSKLDQAFNLQSVIALPVHAQTDRSISNSMIMKLERTEDGRTVTFVRVSTLTLAWVNGRVLFLYTFGEQEDLTWSREASARWVAGIQQANRTKASGPAQHLQ
jgi:hypothetical protein